MCEEWKFRFKRFDLNLARNVYSRKLMGETSLVYEDLLPIIRNHSHAIGNSLRPHFSERNGHNLCHIHIQHNIPRNSPPDNFFHIVTSPFTSYSTPNPKSCTEIITIPNTAPAPLSTANLSVAKTPASGTHDS